MASYPTIAASPRTEFGKGAARRARRAGQVPGVIYGLDVEAPIHFTVSILELHALLRAHGSNAVLELDIEGDKHLTMVKHVDQNVLTLNADHVDLLAIKRGEKVEVEVPVTLEGAPVSGMLVQDIDHVLVEADVLNIPERITHSVEGLEEEARVYASELVLPEGVTLVTDGETVIASIERIEAEEEEASEEASDAEGAAE
ncbi:50S ribosomal protein L25/general stress protein Ctc [Corynebacterium sp. SCR221107]|uniref:50S ribosomal protein L25/general stress protein Ctc n=1 Tax=Corynebacterium sp. SCR221107 TaxID=3017361 RepID=UPI0022EC2502|nr:50S ribosomal protein L25/general stress protein Ctc [Corynebacterium sp. SCR221107]WBT09625.1 50S ribosomal protein L25/general stress protein Ctc [Corynebacterium sp. SCR221107]